MISDVLRESIAEIERYLKDEPEMYRSVEIQIATALDAMTDLLEILNTPPSRTRRGGKVKPERK
jgi:hypothetical protein